MRTLSSILPTFVFQLLTMKLYYKFKKGNGYVLLIYTHLSNRIELSPSVICNESDFGDGKKDNPIKKTDAYYDEKNTILRSFKENVYLVINKIKSEGAEPTTDLVKLGMKQFRRDLLLKKHIETTIEKFPVLYVMKEKYIKSLDKNSTYRSIIYRMKILEDFIKKRGDELLDFREIDVAFYNELENYLVNKEYSNSTTAKIISQFRQFLNFALISNYTSKVYMDYRTKLSVGSKNPLTLKPEQIIELKDFKEFDYSSNLLDEEGKPIYLKYYKGWYGKSYMVKDELFETIKDPTTKRAKRDSKGYLVGMETKNTFNHYTTFEIIKDLFLFSIATGLRWSDCVKVKVGDKDIKNEEYSIIQQKTKDIVPIIENELSRVLYQKYSKGKSVFQYLFPINCKKNDFTRQNYLTKVNEHLKDIGEILKFNNSVNTIKRVGKNPSKNPSVPFYQLMSFHMGRRSHATILSQLGVDMKSISQQMGHSNMTMTGKYISKDDEKLKSVFDFLKPNVSNIKNPNSTPSPIDDDLKSQLSKLKLMFDEGLLSKEAYDDRVELMLDKYGFK